MDFFFGVVVDYILVKIFKCKNMFFWLDNEIKYFLKKKEIVWCKVKKIGKFNIYEKFWVLRW